ncbi:MAG: ADP-ribosylglycohydrolase family protein [Deltaproteobacteria bacterium]|nr:ADP-ribosylglycohydrolase family protein [Deltaproteobacteria bacterium]
MPTTIPDDAALGAILGALVGDASGAVLEFFEGTPGPSDVERALALPGGGVWSVAPGQVTDDGELTMSLLRALVEHPNEPTRGAAERYAAWVDSGPFDIGATTARSLGCTRDPAWAARAREAGVHVAMTEAARERCMPSKANGSLMRATPLGVWGALRTDDALIAAARADCTLSHPNPACVDAVVIYTLAIASLVRVPGDVRRAIERAGAWARENACEEVRGWLDGALAGEAAPFTPQDGFVRIGFMHAFRHLAQGTPYVAALRATLEGGGDTDTNACIVGGLLGARDGAEAIPLPMRSGVLGCDTRKGANPRPIELHPGDVPQLVHALLHGSA